MNALNNLKLIKANFKLLQHLKYIKKIYEIFRLLKKCIQKDNKIIFCGNGSYAADSEHLWAELIGKYLKKRSTYPAISIVSNVSVIPALGNDYGFDNIFLRQVVSIGNPREVLFAMSTRGFSKNILKVIKFAKKI